jgi:AraC-like DNA-binding protein
MESYRIKLMLFQQMVCCCHNFYFWEYDKDYNILQCNCKEPEAFHQCLMIELSQNDLTPEERSSCMPIVISSSIHMMWIALPFNSTDSGEILHILGPFFIDDVSQNKLDLMLLRKGIGKKFREQITSVISTLPVISWNLMQDYCIMMCNAITDKQIRRSDIFFHSDQIIEDLTADASAVSQEPMTHGTYLAEQKMLQMVRDGNMEVLNYMHELASVGQLGKLANGDSLRQMQNSLEVSVILFSRAAIDGGLSPELSLSLTDHYFQLIEAIHSIGELSPIASAMQRDFVERVHQIKMQQYSKPIAMCCDFITLHLEEPLSIAELAAQIGYSDYYCSKKFKKETGMSPQQYIKKARLEAAANLLAATNDDISEIASRYQFGSLSYFSDCFKKAYGMSPSEYREQGSSSNG